MKISELIKLLQEQKKKWGNCEIYFSQDEEGNGYCDDCIIDFYLDDVIALYPCGNYFLDTEDMISENTLR